jgi:hypothetical protein
MLPVIDPAVLSVINEAKSAARALAWAEAGLRQMREFEAAMAPPPGLMESLRQIREVKAFVAPPPGLMESLYQIPEAVPTTRRTFAARQIQSDREREPAAPIAPAANSCVAPPAPAFSKKQNKGNWAPRLRTRAAAVALGFYVADKGYNRKLTPSGLAKHAADFAAEQGFKDAELLDPGDSTLRLLAEDYLAAMAKVVANK